MNDRFTEDGLAAKGFVVGKDGSWSKPKAKGGGIVPNAIEPPKAPRKGEFEMHVNDPTGKGTDLESKVSEICKHYLKSKSGIDLVKVDPPTKVIRKGGIPKVIMCRNPFLDYTGCLKRRGFPAIAIHVEAKSTKCVNPMKNGRLRVRQKSGITERQFDALRRWHRAGCWVGAIWQCGNMIRWVSFKQLSATAVNDVKHVKFANAQPIFSGRGVTHDFAHNLELDYFQKSS